ncbi:MAG: M23 family metallopeptidase [Fibrobacterales bacterium]
MAQFDYSNHRRQGPKKIPLLRILLLAFALFGLYQLLGPDTPSSKKVVQTQKKATKKTSKKKSSKRKQPLLLIDSSYSVKVKTHNNKSKTVHFQFVDKKPVLLDSSKILSPFLLATINRALIIHNKSREPLSVSFHTTEKNVPLSFVIANGTQSTKYARWSGDSGVAFIDKNGCTYGKPCLSYPGRVELLTFDKSDLVNFKGAIGTTVKSIHNGTVTSVNHRFQNGSLVTIHHGNNLNAFYSGLDSATIKVSPGDHVNTGTPLAKISERAPSFFLTMLRNNQPTSFVNEWRDSYPIRSSKTLKTFVEKHF